MTSVGQGDGLLVRRGSFDIRAVEIEFNPEDPPDPHARRSHSTVLGLCKRSVRSGVSMLTPSARTLESLIRYGEKSSGFTREGLHEVASWAGWCDAPKSKT